MWESHAPSPLGPYFAGAAFFHAFFIVLSAHAARGEPAEPLEATQQEEIRRYLAAADERTALPDKMLFGGEGESRGRQVNDQAGNGTLAGGAKATGREGKMGAATSRGAGGRYASERGERGAPAEVSRQEALADARQFGMVGIAAEDGNRAPFASWGRGGDDGPDVWRAKEGALWGNSIGDAWGAGGIGLSGVGEGGGGRGEGIGLGSIGTIGHTWGEPGDGTGGGGSPRMEWFRYPSVPYVRPKRRSRVIKFGAVQVATFGAAGSTRPTKAAATDMFQQAVSREARRHLGRLALCYDHFLDTSPALKDASATTSILIGRQGTVLSSGSIGAVGGGSTLPVCVARSFLGAQFSPPPGEGTAVATVPVTFQWVVR